MGLKQRLFGFLYFKVLGWKTDVTVPDMEKCIICSAPHTSNWDLFIGKLFIGAIGRQSGFLMKSDWFFWPLGPIFRWMGGIPVIRTRHTSMTQQIIEVAKQSPRFVLCITPEGTRSANPDWKKGFWYIAKGSGLPIVLTAVDYEKKTIYMNRIVQPSENVENDIREIKLYYKDFKGKHPEKFTIGEV